MLILLPVNVLFSPGRPYTDLGFILRTPKQDYLPMIYSESILRIGSWQFGWTHDLVYDCGQPYLERWIIWCGITLRLHRFHKGDDDRAFHDHPWWFITFPLSSYMEHTPGQEPVVISSWRPHFRGASHRHIVTLLHPRPVWT
ncbi:MAG TPA: hypothetical protein DCP57_06075, partial [Gammaproteobacteria bacterium]|nr:hypothetical protein [Gammaproteobacteria bacterium]